MLCVASFVCLVPNFFACLVPNFIVCLVANFIVCPVTNFIVCLVISSHQHLICLVGSFWYDGLVTLALVAFGRVRALCAHWGTFWHAMH